MSRFPLPASPSPFPRSRSKKPAATAARTARPDLPQRLIVAQQRNARRALSDLLGREQRLRSRAENRHLIDRLILGDADTLVRLVDVVLVRKRREVLRDRRPDPLDRFAVSLVQDRDAVG